ncbi:MAG: PQQ-like beta-propeller repeat protein [Thermoplasmatales archaeon]|nr:MAG: PQQ-like beta-propeller repeat protein [Thermoplasmatales archaeon]
MKKALAVAVILLFIGVAVSPMVIGFEAEAVNDETEELLDNLAFYCYDESDNNMRYEHYKRQIQKDNSIVDIDEANEDGVLPVESFPVTKTGGLMDSAWPMLNHDVSHTGRSPYSTANVTGLEKWRACNFLYGWGGLEGGPIIDDDGIIYYGDMDHIFYAVYPNGTQKWKSDELVGPIRSTPAIDENGILYIGTIWAMPNYFYAIYSENGSIKWRYETGHHVDSCPAIGNDGTIYFGDWNGLIHALYPNGTMKWRFKADGAVLSSPVIGEDGTIFCGCHVGPPWAGRFYALYPNGTLRWQYNASHWVRVGPCIGDDGIVYFVSLDGFLHAAYPNNGTLKWKVQMPDAGTYPTIGPDGTIYAGWEELRAIYPNNGTIKWQFNPGDDRCIEGGAPIISADGTIYFGTRIRVTDGGEIIALYSNGTEKWRKMICNEYIDSSLAIGEDGTVYIGSTITSSGYLHAFGPVESNSPPETPTIYGETNGLVNEEYWYKIRAVDPDNNPISFYIDWDDRNKGWTRERASGENCSYLHTWKRKGNYTIRVKAKDVLGEESDWATLEVTMPHSYHSNWWMRWLDRFPLLQRLMGWFIW